MDLEYLLIYLILFLFIQIIFIHHLLPFIILPLQLQNTEEFIFLFLIYPLSNSHSQILMVFSLKHLLCQQILLDMMA